MPEMMDFDFPHEEPVTEPVLEPRSVTAPAVSPSPESHTYLWFLTAAAVGVAVLVYFAVRQRTPEAPVKVSAPPAAAVAAPDRTRLGGDGANITLPRLDDSDGLVRTMAAEVTSDPLLVRWLATGGLIRNLAVVTSNIGEGANPAKHLRALAPSGPFKTMRRGGTIYIDPQSYERYTPIARALASMNAEVASQAYATMRPLIDEAYRDLGFETPFDRTFERALVRLIATPIPADPIALVPTRSGVGYAFADPSLEALSPAQKQLLRFGPENAMRVQEALRSLALALGIPDERLPRSTAQPLVGPPTVQR